MILSYEKWKSLKHQPLIINIAGPARCGRKQVASLLTESLRSFYPSLKIGCLHMGYVFRVLTKKALEDGIVVPVNSNAVPAIDDNALNKIAETIKADFNKGEVRIGGLDHSALADLDWNLDVDNLVSFIAHREPARTTLAKIRRGIRNKVEEWADIVVTSELGQHPRSLINFYLSATQEKRANLFAEKLRQYGKEIDPNLAMITTRLRDEEDLERLNETYEILKSNLYGETDVEDPANRLKRYAGHFTALDANSLNDMQLLGQILPLVLAAWQTFRQSREERERLLEAFVHDRAKSRIGRLSLLMLKGGEFGGLSGVVNSKILRLLARNGHFDYVLGTLTENRLESVIRRWDRIREWSRNLRKSIEADTGISSYCKDRVRELVYRAEGYDHIRMGRAIEQLIDFPHQNELLIREVRRIQFFLQYVKQESQYILLWRNSNRSDVVKSWNIEESTIRKELDRAVREKKIQDSDFRKLDEQDFVKLVLVGDGNSDRAHLGSLRNMVNQELVSGSMRDMVHAEMIKGLSKEHLFSIANAVHGPNGPMEDELPLEITLLPLKDVTMFTTFIHAKDGIPCPSPDVR